MLEYWTNDSDQMVAYVAAAELFGFRYTVEPDRPQYRYHITVYTDRFRAAAQQASNLAQQATNQKGN